MAFRFSGNQTAASTAFVEWKTLVLTAHPYLSGGRLSRNMVGLEFFSVEVDGDCADEVFCQYTFETVFHLAGNGGAQAAVRAVIDALPDHKFVFRTDVKS